MKNFVKCCVLFFVVFCILIASGCRKYKQEKYEEINNNETAFVINLEGEEQAKIDSLEALEQMRVSSKRIQISQRWKKTGRMYWDGEWIPTIKVIKVNRSPVTREWTSETNTGTLNKDQGIWAESKDSVGFSVGFNCTAKIEEENTAKFLYNYPNGDLSSIMDSQIRAEIQSVASEVALIYPMDTLREQKAQIISEVRKKVIPFFEQYGITITTIGMFGGFTYENKEIQESIDKTFVAQQEKVVSKAILDAQEDKNKKIISEAKAIANASIEKAIGDANSIQIQAKAEAERIRLIAKAAEEANQSPVFIKLKMIETFEKAVEKWQGTFPQQLWMMGNQKDLGGIIIDANRFNDKPEIKKDFTTEIKKDKEVVADPNAK